MKNTKRKKGREARRLLRSSLRPTSTRSASRKIELTVGDVLIVPPGVIHGWADIPDHVDYLSFRPSHGVMKNGWVNPTVASK